jgi:hypothetical protein
MEDPQSQPIGATSSGPKPLGKRESGSLESNNLHALSQPGQRPGSSTLFQGNHLNGDASSLTTQPQEHANMMDRYYNR